LSSKVGDKEVVIFEFFVLAVWTLKAEEYVREHVVGMYPLLPAMEGANASLLIKAIDEMVEYYQRRNEEQLAEDLKWMGVVLRRAKILPAEEKQEVEEKLSMYDDLLERDPKIRKLRKQSKVEGRAEGKAEGLQEAVVTIVKRRFPTLTELAEQKVAGITKPAQLESLLEQVVDAPDEAAARFLLSTKADRSEEVERVR